MRKSRSILRDFSVFCRQCKIPTKIVFLDSMLKYIVKRIAIFIPTLFVISLVTFYLSVNVPGDPVEQMLNSNSEMGSSANAQASEKAYIDKREQLRAEFAHLLFQPYE
jgi:ABC-type dipeptide/oligopeptide/nickel transport system permease component